MNNPSEAVRDASNQLVSDIDTMRDAYLNREQRAAYERITALAAEVEGLREKLRDMHRRAQTAESAIGEYKKIQARPPDGNGVRFVNGNFGRILLNSYCYKLTEQAEQAEAKLAACEADARRYRWIELNAEVDAGDWVYWPRAEECTPLAQRVDQEMALDDAAMQEKRDG